MTRGVLLAVGVLLAACPGGSDPGDGGTSDGGLDGGATRDFQQTTLADLTTECEGVPGLTGQAILDVRADFTSGVMHYITPAGDRVNPTDVVIPLNWPANPEVTCYPPYDAPDVNPAPARIAIGGLTMMFTTSDGEFDESLNAKAWLYAQAGTVGPAHVLAVTKFDQMTSAWQLDPSVIEPNPTMTFMTTLTPFPAPSSGNVGMGNEDPENLENGAMLGRFAVAVWP